MTGSSNVPGDLDLLTPWFDVIRALRAAGMSGGYSIVRLSVLTDDKGRPVQYPKIEAKKLSPLTNKQAFEEFLASLE